LSFARRSNLKPEVLNPNAVLMEFETLATRAAGEHAPVTLDLDSTVHPVRVDAAELQAAMLNLITNARDAMPDGGSIRVSSRNLELAAEDAARPPDIAAGAYVRLAVSDQGTGMDAATLARVFEPFFTTKPVGSGTGLGLSQVYGFAKDAGGWVDIDSAPGRGTTVTVNLPRSGVAQDIKPASESAALLRAAAPGETVLVVEDDPDVMASTRESLADLGYQVLTAADARAALAIIDGETRIDILFSDVVMPGGMNGAQLAVEARRLRPALKVLLTSGYAGGALGDQRGAENVPMLAKPYRREDLAQQIRLVLSADGER
jgi:CheY-like chemotaxis protein